MLYQDDSGSTSRGRALAVEVEQACRPADVAGLGGAHGVVCRQLLEHLRSARLADADGFCDGDAGEGCVGGDEQARDGGGAGAPAADGGVARGDGGGHGPRV